MMHHDNFNFQSRNSFSSPQTKNEVKDARVRGPSFFDKEEEQLVDNAAIIYVIMHYEVNLWTNSELLLYM